jgi:formate transporter
VIAVTMPIALFVASGFEHSVANMFMIPLGVLIRSTAGTDFWDASGLAPEAFTDLTWQAFLMDNLLPVTLGNIVGGGVMIGVLYWTVFHLRERPAPEPSATS